MQPLLGKAALFLGSTLLIVALVEAGFRLFLPQNLINNHSIVLADSEVEKRLVPDSTFEFASAEYKYTVRTNAIGFRDYEHQVVKATGVKRVLLLGDSFTYGPGVQQEQIYPAVTERILNRNKAGQEYEVLSMACGGYGPEHYLAVLKTFGLKFNPDVVVAGLYVENDITDWLDLAPQPGLPDRGYRERALYAVNNFLEQRSHFFIFARARLDYPLWRLGLRPYYFPEVFRTPVSQELEAHWQKTYRALSQISSQCAKINADFLVMLIPTLYQVSEKVWHKTLQVEDLDPQDVELDLPQKRLRAFAARESIECLDLLRHFRSAGESQDLYFRLDRHWNEAGHALTAELLAEEISKL